jgi:hypothetical protein
MNKSVTRRNFLASAGVAALAASSASALAAESPDAKAVKILGVSCSPRNGMTTAKAVQAALDAARAVDARSQTELIDLGGLNIAPWSPQPPEDDLGLKTDAQLGKHVGKVAVKFANRT